MGLAGDNEQLSPLSVGRLSRAHHTVNIDAGDGGLQRQDHGQHEPALHYGDDEEGETDEATGDDADAATHADSSSNNVALSDATDPSRSGEFDREAQVGCFRRFWRAVLRFPALSSAFPLTLILSLFATFICAVASPDAFASFADPTTKKAFLPSSAGFVISLLTAIFLAIIALLATRQLLYQLFQGEIKPLQIIGLCQYILPSG